MPSLRYRAFEAIRTHKADTTTAIIALFGSHPGRTKDAVNGLTKRGDIKRYADSVGAKAGRYYAVRGAVVLPDGRGRSPGSAHGRKLGPSASTSNRTGKKRTALPKLKRLPELEQCWPSVVRASAWRSIPS